MASRPPHHRRTRARRRRLDGGAKALTVYRNISGLASHTTYHFRLVAQNAFGTTYGADRAFSTP